MIKAKRTFTLILAFVLALSLCAQSVLALAESSPTPGASESLGEEPSQLETTPVLNMAPPEPTITPAVTETTPSEPPTTEAPTTEPTPSVAPDTTETPAPSVEPTPSAVPDTTETPAPTLSPDATIEPSASPEATAEPAAASPSPTASPEPSATPSPVPTLSPSPSPDASATPTPTPTPKNEIDGALVGTPSFKATVTAPASKTAAPNATVTVTVSLTNTLQNCGGIILDLTYDNTRLSVAGASCPLSAAAKEINTAYAANKVRLVYVASNIASPAALSGAVLTVSFTVKSAAPAGTAAFSVSVPEICDAAGNKFAGTGSGDALMIGLMTPVLATPSVSATGITLIWNAIPNATRYRICRGTSSGAVYWTYTSYTTSFIDTNATFGTTYYYKIVAEYLSGSTSIVSAASNLVSAKGNALATPVLATPSVSATGITLTWSAVPNATRYRICRGTSSGAVYWTYTSYTTSFIDTNATFGTTYYYKIVAEYLSGSTSIVSAASNLVSARGNALATPVLATPSVSATGITLTWNAVPNATRYRVCRGTASGAVYWTYTSYTTSFIDTNATFGTTYYYKIVAEYLSGSTSIVSAASNLVSAKGNALATPVLATPSVSATGITLTWSAVPNATRYRICRGTSSGAVYWTYTSYTTSFIDTNATFGTTYYYKIVAEYLSGSTSIVSAASNLVSTKGNALATPVLVTPTVSASGIRLSWNVVPNATRYRVCRGTASGTVYWTYTSHTTSFIDTNATFGTTYYYKIVAEYLSGSTSIVSAASNLVSAKGNALATPVLATPSVSATGITLTWNAVPNATRYRVCRGTSSGAVYWTYTSYTTSFIDTNATFGTTYYYKIVAEYLSGSTSITSAASNLVRSDKV